MALPGWILSFQESKSETVKHLITILNFNAYFIMCGWKYEINFINLHQVICRQFIWQERQKRNQVPVQLALEIPRSFEPGIPLQGFLKWDERCTLTSAWNDHRSLIGAPTGGVYVCVQQLFWEENNSWGKSQLWFLSGQHPWELREGVLDPKGDGAIHKSIV